MGKSGSDGKVSNTLVAASCAAVLAVYAAGYSRTQEAAERFEQQSAERRPGSRERSATATSAEVAAAAPGVRPQAAPDPVQAVAAPSATVIVAPSRPDATAPTAAANIAPTPAQPAAAVDVVPPVAAPPAAVPAAAPVQVVSTPTTPAPAPTPTPAPAPAAPEKPKWKDGTWYGWGTSRHGDIQAEVVVKDGKIVKSGIAQCLTRYSCDVIDILINQPVQRQSADVDFVSRATESSDAYYYALLEALDASKK